MFNITARTITTVLLALVLLLSTPLKTLGETPERMENADIEESLISGEGEDAESLAENIRMVQNLLKDEDVQALLNNHEVISVASEISARILVWMVQNRTVTMKILAELGVRESELKSIGKIWDSWERISAACEAYMASEDGKQLLTEFGAVKNDPEIQACLKEYRDLLTSKDFDRFLDFLQKASREASREPATANVSHRGSLTQEAQEQHLAESGFIGMLISDIMLFLEQSEWAQDLLPKVATNKNLWTLLRHLSSGNSGLDHLIHQECFQLLNDDEVFAFLQNTLWKAYELYKVLEGFSYQGTKTDSRNTTGEEVAP